MSHPTDSQPDRFPWLRKTEDPDRDYEAEQDDAREER